MAKRIALYMLDILWVGALAGYAFAGYTLVPFHADESTLIVMSRDFDTHFLQNNPAQLYYDPATSDPDAQQLRMINGTIPKYMIGLSWWLHGYTADDLNVDWTWGESYAANVAQGSIPPPDLLHTARLPSTLFLAGSVALLFIAAQRFAGRPIAYLATLYYALNPAVLLNGRRAMMEGSLLFGLVAVLLVGVLFVRARGWHTWLVAALLALVSGLALASKHTNAFVVVSVFIGCGLHALAQRQHIQQTLSRLVMLALAGMLAIGVFIALNPAWWVTPLDAAAYALDERSTLLSAQASGHAQYVSIRHQIQGFYQQVFSGQPMYYEVGIFREALSDSINQYEASGWSGLQWPPVFGGVLFVFFVLGWFCLFDVLPGSRIDKDARWVIGSYAVIITLFVMFVTPLVWQRYYLPVMPVVGMVSALGIVWIARKVWQLLMRLDVQSRLPKRPRR